VSRAIGRGLLILAIACASQLAVAQGTLTNGATHDGTIASAGQIQTWTFPAKAGDAVALNIAERSEAKPPFFPWMRLFDPAGKQVQWATGDLASQLSVMAAATGTYSVSVGSNTFNNNTTGLGAYRLTLARAPSDFAVPSGDEGGTIANGSSRDGTIALGDLDLYKFEARAGEVLSLSIAETSETKAPFFPWIRLWAPNGREIGRATGDLTAQINVAATLSGAYTVVVGSGTLTNNYTGTGTYRLTIANAAGPVTISAGDEGGALVNGANHEGKIPLGDLDVWTFQAAAGDGIAVSIGEVQQLTPNFYPWLRLRSPAGKELIYSLGDLVAQVNAVAPVAGTYAVVVGSSMPSGYVGGTGTYRLTLVHSPEAFAIPAGDEGGELTRGATHAGTIHLGDLDPWTLRARAGETLTVDIKETSETKPGFYPWIRLRGPNGAQLGSSFADKSAQIKVRVPTTGVYTVVVGTMTPAGMLAATGTYALTSSPGLSYSALGDSYSSGEGVLPYTDTGDLLSGCHRSTLAYSRLLRLPDLPLPIATSPDVDFDFYACSGAVTRNVTAAGEGQNGEPPQLATVNAVDATRDLVTISIGGNDAQFMPLVEYCLIHTHCHDLKPFSPHSDATVGELMPLWTTVVKARLLAIYGEIRRATPNAATLVLGYPMLLSGRECSAVQVPGAEDAKLSAEEQPFLREMNVRLNRAIAEAAAATGLHFVPVEQRFEGHEICGAQEPWINGLVPLNPKASFHPTARGQREYAEAASAYLESKRTGWALGYLRSGLPRNPNPGAAAAATAVPLPEFARSEVVLANAPADCGSPGQRVVPGGSATLRSLGFAANEAVRLQLSLATGQTFALGTALADAAGGVVATVTIPAAVPVGTQGVLEASGAGASGRGRIAAALVSVVVSTAEACRAE
jgi:lysophospholipase L1-like esterase